MEVQWASIKEDKSEYNENDLSFPKKDTELWENDFNAKAGYTAGKLKINKIVHKFIKKKHSQQQQKTKKHLKTNFRPKEETRIFTSQNSNGGNW